MQEANLQNVENDAEGPHVNLLAVATLHEDLRGNVVRGAASSLEGDVVIDELGKTEVSDKDVLSALAVLEQKVLRL